MGACIRTAGAALALILVAGAVTTAHHSFAAEWDAKNCREFTGVLAKLDWQNPHPYFFVDVRGEGGKTETFVMQGDDLISIAAGQKIGEYRVDQISEASIAFTYLPLKTKQTLNLE